MDTVLLGRDQQITDLLELAASTGDSGALGTVAVCAIDGMAGIGKTALAVHAGHLLAKNFPDGQLFVDLHAHSHTNRPRDPGDALGLILQALGLDLRTIPAELEERAKIYRDRLAGTRTLVLLDDAATEQQVRPLLPAAPGCLVLVTSRKRLKALDDACPVPLDVLEPADAIALLRRHAGPGRITLDDPVATRIAEMCGYLPLALRITAAIMAHRRSWTTEHLEARLRSGLANLAAFNDGARQVAAAFNLSYDNLTGHQQSMFRRLGLIPGVGADAYAAAALLDTGLEEADSLLQDLTDRSLLIESSLGRYRLHDLLRLHARSQAVAVDPTAQRDKALDRLLHYYAYTAQSASRLIAHLPRPAPGGPDPTYSPDLTDPEAARAWLRIEHPNLDAAHAHAITHDLDRHTIALAAGMAEAFISDGPWDHALQIYQAAEAVARTSDPAAHATILYDLGQLRHLAGDYLGAANAQSQALKIFRQIGNRLGEANTLNILGRAQRLTGDYLGATDAQSRALEIYRQTGSRTGEAAALTDLGRVRYATGDYLGAADAQSRALEIYQQTGNRYGEAWALTDLGRLRILTGDYPGAADAQSRALEIFREIGNRLGEANALTNLGRVRHATGDYPGAADAQSRALEIFREIGNRLGEANALTNLGRVRHATGDYPGAADAQSRALEIFRQTGNRGGEAWALNFYAATVAMLGEGDRALALYHQALAMNRELNKPDDEAFSMEGIADHHLVTANPFQGLAYLNQALEIYQRLGMQPGIERVQAKLSEISTQ